VAGSRPIRRLSARKIVERAPAKINLSLGILGRRADGYHLIDSIVAFASEHDRLTFVPGRGLGLALRGRNVPAAGPVADNLVIKAAYALADQVPGLGLGRFELTKRLPIAAGIGGGSADAAAALRLLARANRLSLDDPRLFRAARIVGADVPVCVDPKPRLMRGIGEQLSQPLPLPRIPALLINPGVAVATRDVFASLGLKLGTRVRRPFAPRRWPRGRDAWIALLAKRTNDLEAPAVALQPVIAEVLAILHQQSRCELARMSGSGATCFGLFATPGAAASAARAISRAHPRWWIKAVTIGGV
jgi:4-diphosphocytidyl-2-C-methyl-D-erythritol kinase